MCAVNIKQLFLTILCSVFFVTDANNTQIVNTNFDQSGPLLAVVLMVKNEGPVIQATLEPYLKGGVTSVVILDTGSTDDTIQKAREILKKYRVDGYIFEQPFVDFATSRNYAIQCAEEVLPNAVFFLMPDAEWYMHNVSGLLDYCASIANQQILSCVVRIGNDYQSFYTPRLFRAHCGVCFEGVVHEVLNNVSYIQVPHDIYFELKVSPEGHKKSYNRWFRDRDLLLAENEKNPNNPRTLFYLAQTCSCIGDHEEAAFWYEKRCETPGWDEENYMARYRLAQVYEAMNDWQSALQNYLLAYDMRRSRAEPLIAIAQHYWNTGNYPLCYVFSKASLEIPCPEHDLLSVEKQLYDCTRYDLLGRAAGLIGYYELGEWAVRKALEAAPDCAHLHYNLSLYLGRKR